MKIAFFIYSMGPGGAERVTSTLSNHWVKIGYDISVITLTPTHEDFYQLHPAVHRIVVQGAKESKNIFSGLFANLARVWSLRKALRKTRPDVVIAMGNTSSVLLAFAGLRLNEIVLIGSERYHPPQLPLAPVWSFFRRLSYSWLDGIVTQSCKSAEWVKTNTAAKKVYVIPNPVVLPLENYPPRIDQSVPADGRKILMTVGRFTPEKQHLALIGAVAPLLRARGEWVFFILGDGPLRQSLEHKVADAGLSNRILMPGRAGNLGEWYTRADLFVLSSSFEGFPNTLVEAMAHGVPAVSFDCDTGPAEIIRHEVDGLLIAPGDWCALQASLTRLIDYPEERVKFGARAVEVMEYFSLEKVSGKWGEAVGELLQ